MMSDQKTLLLVEDDLLMALCETIQLEQCGYIVQHVSTGEEAIHAALRSDSPVDLILMNIDLGSELDGMQAAQEILQHIEIPIVFVSSYTEPEIVKTAQNISPYGYVVKNSNLIILDTAIRVAFKVFAARNALQEKDTFLAASAAHAPTPA